MEEKEMKYNSMQDELFRFKSNEKKQSSDKKQDLSENLLHVNRKISELSKHN